MVNEQKIQQLAINRAESHASSPRPFYFWLSVSLILAVVIIFSLQAFESSGTKQQKIAPSILSVQSPADNTLATSTGLVAKEEKLQSQASALDASGHVVARRIATVSSRVTGKLEQLHIEEGVKVSRAQVLAELDDEQAKISYQLAQAELQAQQALYQEILVKQQHAERESQRQDSLIKEQLISKQRRDDSQLKLAQLAAQKNHRQAMIQQAEQRAAMALYQLEQHKIRAPFDGVVISKNAQVGELISAGGASGGTIRTGVGTIVDMSSLEVEVEVGESYINRVFPGQQVLARLDAYPQWKIDSEVVAVIPTADRQKASIKVRIKLFQIDQRVLPDMGVKVSFLNQAIGNEEQLASL